MFVTIICAKIFYGNSAQEINQQIASYQANGKRAIALNPYLGKVTYTVINQQLVQMSDSQFVRFKNAGRRHASHTKGKSAGGISRERQDRTGDNTLHKWDVDHYGNLTGRQGPWGNGSLTNRDHMTANSSNQMRNAALPANVADSHYVVKRDGLAITVSGKHHRQASYTYGGRTKSASPIPGMNRTEYGANHPTQAFQKELGEMLSWKFSHSVNGVNKNTLRLEMVGAYCYMYKKSVDTFVTKASIPQDNELIEWIRRAVQNDNHTGNQARY